VTASLPFSARNGLKRKRVIRRRDTDRHWRCYSDLGRADHDIEVIISGIDEVTVSGLDAIGKAETERDVACSILIERDHAERLVQLTDATFVADERQLA